MASDLWAITMPARVLSFHPHYTQIELDVPCIYSHNPHIAKSGP
jgi:hypothetical protein